VLAAMAATEPSSAARLLAAQLAALSTAIARLAAAAAPAAAPPANGAAPPQPAQACLPLGHFVKVHRAARAQLGANSAAGCAAGAASRARAAARRGRRSAGPRRGPRVHAARAGARRARGHEAGDGCGAWLRAGRVGAAGRLHAVRPFESLARCAATRYRLSPQAGPEDDVHCLCGQARCCACTLPTSARADRRSACTAIKHRVVCRHHTFCALSTWL